MVVVVGNVVAVVVVVDTAMIVHLGVVFLVRVNWLTVAEDVMLIIHKLCRTVGCENVEHSGSGDIDFRLKVD